VPVATGAAIRSRPESTDEVSTGVLLWAVRARRAVPPIASASSPFVVGTTAAAEPKEPKIKINKACTMLVEKKITKAFWSPVAIVPDAYGGRSAARERRRRPGRTAGDGLSPTRST
jgi:hypothetical protein